MQTTSSPEQINISRPISTETKMPDDIEKTASSSTPERVAITHEFNDDDAKGKPNLNIVIMTDPIEELRNDFAIAARLKKRGHNVAFTTPQDLTVEIKDGRIKITAQATTITSIQCEPVTWVPGDISSIQIPPPGKASLNLMPPAEMDLAQVDLILLRQDPHAFAQPIQLLRSALPPHVVVEPNINAVLLNGCEKLIFNDPSILPDTILTRNMAKIKEYADKSPGCIAKPLDEYGGTGIVSLRSGDDQERMLAVEKVLTQPYDYVACQKKLRGISKGRFPGDISFWYVKGKKVSQIRRVPASEDGLANTRAGGKIAPYEVRESDIPIIEGAGAALRNADITVARSDFIRQVSTDSNGAIKEGPIYKTEDNYMSPGLIMESEALNIVEAQRSGEEPIDLLGEIARAWEDNVPQRGAKTAPWRHSSRRFPAKGHPPRRTSKVSSAAPGCAARMPRNQKRRFDQTGGPYLNTRSQTEPIAQRTRAKLACER